MDAGRATPMAGTDELGIDGLQVLSNTSVFLAVVRRAGPHLIEASLIPTVLFYACFALGGMTAALAGALAWLYATVAYRLARRLPVPPLLVLAAIGITVRTFVALASGSTFLYFAQPILGSVVMGCVFLVSVVVGRPMVERLALEFWPLTPEMMARLAVLRLLRRLTVLWAGVNLAIAAATMALLTWMPIGMYPASKQVVSLSLMGIGIAITIDRAVRMARKEGFAAERSAPIMLEPVAA